MFVDILNHVQQKKEKKMKIPGTHSKKYKHNSFFIGLLSFFGGVSQDIFVPVIPLYLATVLHLDKAFIGFTEGVVTSSASIFKIVSGFLSDRFRKNKPIVFLGYFLSFVSRPLLALATSGFAVLGLRFLDGIGKGVKDSAKDALIADSTQKQTRGREFGIVRALDTLGSVAGPILLFFLLYFLRNNNLKYHYIFFITAIPLLITLSILSLFVKEVPIRKEKKEGDDTHVLPVRFYFFLAIVLLFSIGNSSSAFLILRAQNIGVGLLTIPLVYALFNFIYASVSIPLGSLSDRIGREKVILLGWVCYAIAYLGFALAAQQILVWVFFSVYGLYFATTEGVAKAFIADLVVPQHRGKAYGVYNSLIGIATLPASVIAGILWDKINPSAPFFFGAAIAAFASVCLFVFTRFYKKAYEPVVEIE